jgi:hypothetical protein
LYSSPKIHRRYTSPRYHWLGSMREMIQLPRLYEGAAGRPMADVAPDS